MGNCKPLNMLSIKKCWIYHVKYQYIASLEIGK